MTRTGVVGRTSHSYSIQVIQPSLWASNSRTTKLVDLSWSHYLFLELVWIYRSSIQPTWVHDIRLKHIKELKPCKNNEKSGSTMCNITMYHDLKLQNLMHVVCPEHEILSKYVLSKCVHNDMICTPSFLLVFNNMSVS